MTDRSTGLRQATLVINPAAGNARLLAEHLPSMMGVLREAGFAATCCYTDAAADSAGELARLTAHDAKLVLACGGDGTVHGVVQGMAHSGATLGVVPLGTANALARNLGLSMKPLAALKQLLTYTPTRIPLGHAQNAQRSSFFTVMAGCGPDGVLVQGMSAAHKARFGRNAYYVHAARLFVTRRWPAFAVAYRTPDGEEHRASGAAVMVSRVPDLGGLFSRLTAGAALRSPHLLLHVLRAPAQMSFPAWFALSRAGLSRSRLPNPWLTTVEVEEVRCMPLGHQAVYAQADGEPLGSIPMTLRLVPDALTLLMPG